ncbi:DUF934 domain-containing protein [Hydrocarboniclastica marina]|uniref:DUF934 domain-containing protein n=1 Tax=Hydrocarboniclastica marina TaxID=2259620 RepID=A0A4P7XGR2_9ALTE|nr:DUF934 domain-containing protein [Hydrocarboniclastica marina]MAL96889.1 oxidoreductase [Alteromonadaceae bacterium]QCF26176.1 DUF934 domain-containing protein [Hydrocarboniclastica marina]|tara:strand:- start:352 stop:852 length:501 start_codon:yes stop_codon:yes gene_type:complete
MHNVILRDGTVAEDKWKLVEQTDDDSAVKPDGGSVIVPLSWWLDNRSSVSGDKNIGIWFDSSDEPEMLGEECQSVPIIAVNFPKFTDGRGYSIARLLRERYHFPNELRAIGDVLLDQLFYMKRCGFDTFKLRADKDVAKAQANLSVFGDSYQAAFDQQDPLFRRRF